jgi:hypothetical protein
MSTTRRAAPAAAKPLPYPDLETNEGKLFWLAAYFIDLNKAEAIGRVVVEMYRRHRDELTKLALTSAQLALKDRVADSLQCVIRAGLLPFAHPETRVFGIPVVVR